MNSESRRARLRQSRMIVSQSGHGFRSPDEISIRHSEYLWCKKFIWNKGDIPKPPPATDRKIAWRTCMENLCSNLAASVEGNIL